MPIKTLSEGLFKYLVFHVLADAQQLIEEGTLDMKGAVVAVDWYEDKQAGASDIDDTRTIVVSGLPSDVDEEDIQMYFENRRQKGGPVEKVERDEESGTAVVCFQDCEGIISDLFALGLIPMSETDKQLPPLILRGGI